MPADGGRPVLFLERTALAWQRSALALAVIALLVLVHALHRGEPGGVAAGLVPAVAAGWARRRGVRLYRARGGGATGPAGRALAILTAVTGAVAVLSAAVVVAGHG